MNCKKPNCDCLEQHSKKQGVNIYSVKGGYPCLYDNNNEDEAMKLPKQSEQQPEGETPIIQRLEKLENVVADLASLVNELAIAVRKRLEPPTT